MHKFAAVILFCHLSIAAPQDAAVEFSRNMASLKKNPKELAEFTELIQGMLGKLVNGRKIGGRQDVGAAIGKRQVWHGSLNPMILGRRREIMERPYTKDYFSQCLGDFRVDCIGIMQFSVDLVSVDLRVEGQLNLRGRSTECDCASAGWYRLSLETMSMQPFNYLNQVSIGNPEGNAEFLWGKPVTKQRRSGVLLRFE
jgi:hypothetical protein